MKKVTACILFVVLGLALFAPAIAGAGTNRATTEQQKNSQKTWKKYNKQQAKAQKKQRKEQEKATKKWRKNHPTTTTVT